MKSPIESHQAARARIEALEEAREVVLSHVSAHPRHPNPYFPNQEWDCLNKIAFDLWKLAMQTEV